jgi:hypothetical protein
MRFDIVSIRSILEIYPDDDGGRDRNMLVMNILW